jgi:hypothetical protein
VGGGCCSVWSFVLESTDWDGLERRFLLATLMGWSAWMNKLLLYGMVDEDLGQNISP